MAGNSSPLSRDDRSVGCLLAAAVGDALGAPVEFESWADIEAECGPDGVTGFLPAYGRDGGAITDDTQMTLFTADGLIRAAVRARTDGGADPVDDVLPAHLRWLVTQREAWPAWYPPRSSLDAAGWLFGQMFLHHRRGPGSTCLSALRHGPRGSVEQPINDSKGCGGIMRAAPAGLVGSDDPFRLGVACAALSHGHSSGYLPAGVLASVVAQLVAGADLDAALDVATAELAEWDDHDETTAALEAGRSLAARGRPSPHDIETLGGGWTGEEALAIAVACALAADDVLDGLLLAVNHSGDTDSTGSMTGNLLGAIHGLDAIPPDLVERLEGAAVITEVAHDLCAVRAGEIASATAAELARWQRKYPPS